MARPSKYDPKYCKEIRAYFDRDPKKDLAEVNIKEKFYISPPMFERFARSIGVYHGTLREWRDKHEEFSTAYKDAKELQEAFIKQCLISNIYTGAAAIFAAKNMTGMRDQTQIDHTTKGEKLGDPYSGLSDEARDKMRAIYEADMRKKIIDNKETL